MRQKVLDWRQERRRETVQRGIGFDRVTDTYGDTRLMGKKGESGTVCRSEFYRRGRLVAEYETLIPEGK